MKASKLILAITIITILPGCENLLSKSRETVWLDKNHKYSISNTSIDNVDSCNRLSIMTRERNYDRLSCITKVGDNDHFIIVGTKDDKFWILNKDKDSSNLNPNQILEGPFDSIPFMDRKKQLSIADLDFQKYF